MGTRGNSRTQPLEKAYLNAKRCLERLREFHATTHDRFLPDEVLTEPNLFGGETEIEDARRFSKVEIGLAGRALRKIGKLREDAEAFLGQLTDHYVGHIHPEIRMPYHVYGANSMHALVWTITVRLASCAGTRGVHLEALRIARHAAWVASAQCEAALEWERVHSDQPDTADEARIIKDLKIRTEDKEILLALAKHGPVALLKELQTLAHQESVPGATFRTRTSALRKSGYIDKREGVWTLADGLSTKSDIVTDR